jgi:hypothetical protein
VLVAKPGGGYFLSDPHSGGQASRVRLLEVAWGRLVDVFDVDENGRTNPIPVLRDVAIGENVLSDGAGTVFETSPITHESRLIIERPRDAPDDGQGSFASLLAHATGQVAGVVPRLDTENPFPPVSVVARNGVLTLRFDDLLEDGPETREVLRELVRLTMGYPAIVPQPVRVIFDPSHGGIAHGEFHSTRVVVDFTVSEREFRELPYFVPVNAAGVPASNTLTVQANAALRLPTVIDPVHGRFVRLTNLSGRGLLPEGPVDVTTHDVVRAFRSGNANDSSSGFLSDLETPQLLGSWDVAIEEAHDDPAGASGFAFVVTLRFRTPCRAQPRVGDSLDFFGELYEVRDTGAPLGTDGRVAELHVQRLEFDPLPNANAILGLARYLTPYRRSETLHPTCWVSFVPPPSVPPFEDIPSDAVLSLRFSEPMDATSFRAFDSFRVLRTGSLGPEVQADDLVVGAVRVGQSLQAFEFVPRLPFANQSALQYLVELVGGANGVRDLTGTPLAGTFGRAEFFLADDGEPVRNGGFALRFESRDEVTPPGLPDLRGQVTYDEAGGILRPRQTVFHTYHADTTSLIPSLMIPFAPGVVTPLSPLGSKLQVVWRYCDFGFRVRDENFYNLDVMGLSWSPARGSLFSDFFPQLEMRLSHSVFLPDETGNANTGPIWPASGLRGAPSEFIENLLADPRGEQVIVHPRSLGYQVRQADLTLSSSGTPFIPFPWNHSLAPLTTFTWRDTSVLATGGFDSPGVPLDVEVGPPFFLDTGIGSFAPPGRVPTVGLPLLLEVRCYPSSQALGFNAFAILLPIPGFNLPNFRAFSTGGFDQTGQQVLVDPDLSRVPSGGFNPNSRPPGRPTPLSADNSFYLGQIDTVVRVSRAVTAWIPTGSFSPHFVPPVIEPRSQLGAAEVQVEFRGSLGFSDDSGDAPFDADRIDAYGEYRPGQVGFVGDGTWNEDLRSIDGATFVQIRFTFVNDIQGRISPELDSFGLAFEER